MSELDDLTMEELKAMIINQKWDIVRRRKEIDSVKHILGGTVTDVTTKLNDIDAKILTPATGDITADISTVKAKINSTSGPISTRIGAVRDRIKASSATSSLDTLVTQIINALGGDTNSTIYARIYGSGSIMEVINGDTTSSSTIPSALTAVIQSINASGTQLLNVINAANGGLGSSGTTQNRISALIGLLGSGASIEVVVNAINSSLGSSNSTQARISTLIGLLGGGVSIEAILNAIDSTLGGSGPIQTKLSLIYNTVGGTADNLSGRVSNIYNTISGSGGTIKARLNNILSMIDGVVESTFSTFTVTSSAANISGSTVSIVGSGMTLSIDVSGSIGAGQEFKMENGINYISFVNMGNSIGSASALVTYLAQMYPVGTEIKQYLYNKLDLLRTNITSSGTLLSSVGISNTDLFNKLGTTDSLHSTLDTIMLHMGGSSNLTSRLDVLNLKLYNSTNWTLSLTTKLDNVFDGFDNSTNQIAASYYTVSLVTYADDQTTIVTNGGNFVFNFDNIKSYGNIASGALMQSSAGGMYLYNRSGTTINSRAELHRYLRTMYPQNSVISKTLYGALTTTKEQIGGSVVSSVRARLAVLDSSILNLPSGVLATDLGMLSNRISSDSVTILETKLNSVMTKIKGSDTGVLADVIGTPYVSTITSNILSVIGTSSATSIADALGDPVFGTAGLSSLIRNGSDATNTIDVSSFNSEQSLHGQITAFLALMNAGRTIPAGTYSSLADILTAMT